MSMNPEMRDVDVSRRITNAGPPVRPIVLREIASTIDDAYPLEALWLRNMARDMDGTFDRRGLAR